MNYNHLHYFYVVVREGGVSAASRQLQVSQPSLSAQIKALEENLGVSLFERRGKKLSLTPQGKSVYTQAAQMFELSANIADILAQKPIQGTPIRLGIADEVERPFAVGLVKNLFKRWKGAEPPSVTFVTGQTVELVNKLRDWHIDAVITNRSPTFDDLEIAGNLSMPVALVVPNENPKNFKGTVMCAPREVPKLLAELGTGLALPSPRLKLREEIDQFMNSEKRDHRVVFESDTLATIIRAVIDNVGPGFVPLPYIMREVQRKEVTVLGSTQGLWKHNLYVLFKKGRANSVAVTEISDAFEELKDEISREIKSLTFN
jgi:LysR family transcriptional regulator, transcriptional activator of nhaA